jgi:FMN phosphatase YigB (HAD superfamily)
MTHKYAVIVDWSETLFDGGDHDSRFDHELIQKLNDFKNHGVEIYICSNSFGINQHEWLTNAGLDLDRHEATINDSGKEEKDFWQKIPSKIQINADNIIMLDDSYDNCKASKSAGLTTIQWSRKRETRISELEQALVQKGYKPL